MNEIEKRRNLKRLWHNIHPLDRPTWEQFKRGVFTLPQTQKQKDFPMLAIADRERRAKEWTNHMAEVERCGMAPWDSN